MVINQLSARTGLYFWIIPVYFGLFFLREKVVETLLDLVGNLLRILYVVSLGRFDGKTFEQYATPFREGVINSSEIPILTKDTGDLYDVFCGEMLLVLLGSFHIIVPDELQILNDLVEIRLAFADPFMHELRVKDITETSRIDDYSLWLLDCRCILFNGRSLILDFRSFRDRLQFLSFIVTGFADSAGDECINKKP